jgi:hypothetical protein
MSACAPCCFEDAAEIRDSLVCLSPLSKDLEGEIRPIDESEREECRERGCVTIKTVHELRLRAVTNEQCDSLGRVLDGELRVRELTHAFEGTPAKGRGIHAGSFRWTGTQAVATGSLSGITNANTHRQPVFEDREPCEAPGLMEGRLCGRIRRAEEGRLTGCELLGTYRLRFDPTGEGPRGGTRGTLEAVVICRCEGAA